MRERRGLAHVLTFFFPSVACLFKAASAHFRPWPNPLDVLLVSADRSSSVRFGGEVSLRTAGFTSGAFKPAA